jgi:hypothetical protein
MRRLTRPRPTDGMGTRGWNPAPIDKLFGSALSRGERPASCPRSVIVIRPDQPPAASAELFHLILDLGSSEQTSFFSDVVDAAVSTAAPKIPFLSGGHRPCTRDNRVQG